MLRGYIKYFCALGCGMFLLGSLAMSMWVWAAERQSTRIRKLFFQALMRQHIGWFDQQQVGELTARLADDINSIQNGMGEKVSLFMQYFSTFIAGYFVGFIKGWKLTLVIISVAPIVAVAIGALTFVGGVVISCFSLFYCTFSAAYGGAGAVAEEVLSAIKTVAAFGGEKKEVERYSQNLTAARSLGIKKGIVSGFGQGFIQLTIFSSFAISFWYGSKLVREQDSDYSGGKVLQVFLAVLIGSMSFGNAAPNLETFSIARGAAAKVYEIIGLESEIDSSSEEGLKPKDIEGDIKFEDVSFNYPTRADVPVLREFDLEVNVGQTVALVGASGCGKSTSVQLLQRFYDPFQGTIKIGGYDIRDLNVGYLRELIGVVSQEPILFAESISENIRYGREGVTQEEIEKAAQEANAHDFICKLPKKYETLVGERGTQLSGGQKQRVAIARALVRNPRILLLDEATSALDMESEAVVQDALDKVRMGRTTLIIAHRLSTIKTADVIVGIKEGRAVEKGNHEQLMNIQGLYYELVMNQTKGDGEALVDDPFDPEVPLLEKNSILQQSVSPRASSAQRSLRHSLKRQGSVISGSGSIWSEKDEEEAAEKLPPATLSRILRLNSPEVPYIIFGSLSGIMVGAINPVFAVILSELLAVIFNFLFAVTGENLTMRLRKLAFAAILRQDMSYFDDTSNQVGALTARLATDASTVKGAAGPSAGLLTQSVSGMGTGLVIAFVFGWKLALVVVCFLPIIMASGMIQGRMSEGNSKRNVQSLEDGAKLATEAIENIRTVAALTKEKYFMDRYNAHFETIYKKGRLQAVLFGVFFGLSQSIIFFTYAVTYGYGSVLIDNGEMEFKNVFRVFAAITFGGLAAGRASSLSPDFTKAKLAAAKIFALLDRTPLIDSSSEDGIAPETCSGEIRLETVHFHYPSRANMPVLRGLSIEVKRGQKIALVGSSGCGKSTSVQLVERFYDSESGSVKVDGQNVKDVRLSWLRKQIGLVSQEPVLFDMSIRENIAYGDNSRDVAMAEVIEAAKKSNIHNFIISLPKGYETHVGEKGAQLSGGQKQRVAIARALIRNPKILLLDEATSALDTESEKVVQEALDQAMDGRTSIVIAHRLSTIRDADKIVVMDQGRVAEAGSHAELMAAEGLYYKLIQVQNRKHRETAAL
ncbi:hypothetical protein CAPTEDRAFT_197681 [Capitella teleta]|uniref:Bile salt export pump n=1 Tax=Capitella teleta TaxID=283909 RepID=R7VLY6_CAPTE|nr:hypothetical protein CAPTEDRAFT_197681 [Capitella teleta]|eukprot:ELU18040.1 hypothetical protein CAPTEDRAFT_197681 [Capitella teleta]